MNATHRANGWCTYTVHWKQWNYNFIARPTTGQCESRRLNFIFIFKRTNINLHTLFNGRRSTLYGQAFKFANMSMIHDVHCLCSVLYHYKFCIAKERIIIAKPTDKNDNQCKLMLSILYQTFGYFLQTSFIWIILFHNFVWYYLRKWLGL